ncbi:MAG TPA: TonB-dependent receptor, partial [Candidatus Baltobacteraceae bacterium]
MLIATTAFSVTPAVAADSQGAAAAASSAAATADISGTLVNQLNGLPIADAIVTLYQGDTIAAKTTSDARGQYVFDGESDGTYSLTIRAVGYQPTAVNDVFVVGTSTTIVHTPLLLASTDLRQIGYVSISSEDPGNSVAASSTIQHVLNPDQLRAQAFPNAVQALGTIPGIDLSGGQHTAGDDTSVDIRGMGTGEVRPLIDGHPVGPIGVGSADTFDYANSPYLLLQGIKTTVGSGASGLYGVDVIGGTIDFQTVEPTRTKQGEFYQGVGNQGLGITATKVSGTVGRLGYAFGHAVQGTYDDFQPGDVFQSARPNNNSNAQNLGACLPNSAANQAGYVDISTCNQALNTYPVSGNYRVQSDLGKLQYKLSNTSLLTLAAYATNQLSDSTGNGDNDNVPYQTRLAQIENSPPQTSTCASNLYPAITDSNPNSSSPACLTAAQLAAASYGPDGGGEDRNRGTTLQDFHARFNTEI